MDRLRANRSIRAGLLAAAFAIAAFALTFLFASIYIY
jgi:hypothetical protein